MCRDGVCSFRAALISLPPRFAVKLDTYTSCFRIYRRSSMIGTPLKESGFSASRKCLGVSIWRGGTIVEISYGARSPAFGISKDENGENRCRHLKLLYTS